MRLDRACCAVLLGAAHDEALSLLGMQEVLQAAAARASSGGLRGSIKGAPATVRMHGGASSEGGSGPDWEACQYVLVRVCACVCVRARLC